MSKERVLEVADAIESAKVAKEHGIGFNMSHIFPVKGEDFTGLNCGTVCCIAGWVNIMFAEGASDKWSDATDAARRLEIDDYDGEQLFLPRGYECRPEEFTTERAAAVLRHFAETGHVLWDKFGLDGKVIK